MNQRKFSIVFDEDTLPATSCGSKRTDMKQKIPLSPKTFAGFVMKGGVVPPGIEPGTHGFSVRCSTN